MSTAAVITTQNECCIFVSGHPPSSAAYAGSGQSHRVKMTKREMYDASKRVWSQLPEVKAKQVAEKRKSEAVTNRIRMKAYQQVNKA